jgi:hypothetical protein
MSVSVPLVSVPCVPFRPLGVVSGGHLSVPAAPAALHQLPRTPMRPRQRNGQESDLCGVLEDAA